MKIGVPTEIKNHEYRVGLIPTYVEALVSEGHVVYVQSKAGEGSGFSDEEYRRAGAVIVETPEEVFSQSTLIIKVKEPQPRECQLLNKEHILFTYLHLAADENQTRALIDSGCTAIAYETVTDQSGGLPLLTPMSQIAGRLAIQVGAYYLQKPNGGSGVLLGGVPGVKPGHITIIGAGVVGGNSLQMALGMGSRVTVIDKNIRRLQELETLYFGQIETRYASNHNIATAVKESDLVIGAVLLPGGKAPIVVTRDMIKTMRRGSVIVDVAIDQGGCCETSRPTSHSAPIYVEEGVTHYCVTNMPGACPRTSTEALNNATFPFIQKLVRNGVAAIFEDKHFLAGLNVYQGKQLGGFSVPK